MKTIIIIIIIACRVNRPRQLRSYKTYLAGAAMVWLAEVVASAVLVEVAVLTVLVEVVVATCSLIPWSQ